MNILAGFFIALFTFHQSGTSIRQLDYNGTKVTTTFDIEEKFYGKYQGNKQGFLQLNPDGSGIYKYDYTGLSKSCDGELIEVNWGFVIGENNEIIRAERPYGYSYPIIYNCSGANAFKNCTERIMVDYILVYKDGTITISSSDDWKKQN
jgi:hypothetical protein